MKPPIPKDLLVRFNQTVDSTTKYLEGHPTFCRDRAKLLQKIYTYWKLPEEDMLRAQEMASILLATADALDKIRLLPTKETKENF